MPNYRQLEVAENLRKFLHSLPLDSEVQYTRDFWNLEGYTAGGITVAMDLEYKSADDEYPEPLPVFVLSSPVIELPCVVPFGKREPLDDRVRYAIQGFYAAHQLAARAEEARFS